MKKKLKISFYEICVPAIPKSLKNHFWDFWTSAIFFQKVPQKKKKIYQLFILYNSFFRRFEAIKTTFFDFLDNWFFSISRKLFGGNKISDYIIEDWPNINRKSSWENWFWVPKTFWKFLFLRIYPQDSDLYKGLRYTCSGGLNLYAEGG